jgi:PKHD-type hydroxylase
MLLQIPQILDASGLRQARELLAEAAWVDGRGTAGPQAAQAKRNQQLDPATPAAQALRTLVLRALDGHALFFSAALPKRVLPPQFNRYTGDTNHYGNHVDQAIRYGGHGSHGSEASQRVRTDLSCTLFFSEPADYDGGELVIEHSFGQQRLKLAAGDLVLYPGTSVHRVEPVTRGARLASFFWIESMVRRHDQRELLFDMDMALMRLRGAHGESPETVRLTGTYHNLLRMWADS